MIEPAATTTARLFVDEAGVPTLFDGRGNVIVGTEGCSRYFLLGKLQVSDPADLSRKLNTLRSHLVSHPYFAGVPSFDPANRKTAVLFHAKDDVPEVRFQVLDLLAREGRNLRFHAVVCDKLEIVKQVVQRNQTDPGYRYNENDLYDDLIRSLFGKLHRLADLYHVCIAQRGAKNRTAALRNAIEKAEQDFSSRFWFTRGDGDSRKIDVTNPVQEVSLQAVDYFLWALQRFYEPRKNDNGSQPIHEERYLRMLWPQVGEIHDLHFGPKYGTFFTKANPLSAQIRFSEGRQKKKKP